MELLESMKLRHSVRQYELKPIEQEKRVLLHQLIEEINHEADLHIQIFYDEPCCFDSFLAHYGKFSGVSNYIALVGKKSSQLDEKVGYYGEKIVLEAQSMGLNSCWVAMTHGKSKATILKNEKQVCLIALGYGKNQGKAHQSKPLSQVCNESMSAPMWFLNGVKAALLAPTALNQQKFYFEWQKNDKVKASCGKGFYTKVDFGIVKYHFELASQKKAE